MTVGTKANKRKAISKTKRFEIFKRDGFSCQYCGAHPPGTILHVDHIVAVASGGCNDADNLVTSCEACNLGKGARDLTQIPESLTDKARRVAEAEEQLAGYNAVLMAKRQRIEGDAWFVVDLLTGERKIQRDRLQSIKMFVEKIGVCETAEAAEIARSKTWLSEYQQFRYFCGVCWNKAKEDVL